ncbi:LysR substrate-binding domain-containing protein [Agarivorans sp. 1_MG-2023]|uniref:LysR substrate-binding domain-containing protein n=1 Tax=Agarivorans sp. 1_MG-2023 TaxID=3062634 RepID=UPI0026E46B9E|nr:LysR substrate-binding domain-containing protein [Agarivorans sp. 1_MG-2023]MDO6764868.1 LysR substrate-binding domain-containing protein [Agarivorans sp. 1_MG-2023]
MQHLYRFSLKQLSVFVCIAETHSVSAAALQLSMTQSAASMALNQLETGLGQRLFERQGKRLRLNHWGHWLRPRAKRVLMESQHIMQGFAGQQVISGELTVGASQTIAEYFLAQIITKLDKDYPDLVIHPQISNTEVVLAGLLDYRLQLGIIEGHCSDSRIAQQVWCEDQLVVVAGKQHPLASHEEVNLAKLSRARWVLREAGSGTRDIFNGAIHGKITKLKVWREYSHVPSLIALVANGAYLSCLPLRSVEQAIQVGELIALNTPSLDMRRTFNFVWRKDSSQNPLRDCFIEQAQHQPLAIQL